MRVRVLYFGVLREMFRVSDEQVEVAEGAAVGDLLGILRARTSNQATGKSDGTWSSRMTGNAMNQVESAASERLWRSIAVAVNREYSSPAMVLREGDEVALLPPVSGGALRSRIRFAEFAVSVRGRYAD
jgi:molybdopterin converting factor small subunit